MRGGSTANNGESGLAVRKPGPPLGNQNARRSGFYSRVLQPSELRHLDLIADELRALLEDSWHPRFEPLVVQVAGRIWRWQQAYRFLNSLYVPPTSRQSRSSSRIRSTSSVSSPVNLVT